MFSEDDLNKIREAVRSAEQRTRGEIVPMVVPSSARYRESWHLTGLTTALLTLSVLLAFEYGWGSHEWAHLHPGWIISGVVGAYLVGHTIGTFPWCVRLFTSHERMAMKVRRRAESAFYEHGLHRTREGTGVLILLSLLERRAQVLADQGIHKRVPPGTWDAMVTGLVQSIHDGQPTEALCLAIATCGNLLAQYFPAKEGDNPNELSNEMIQGR